MTTATMAEPMARVEEMLELKNIMMIFLADSTQKMHATSAAKVSSVNLVKKRTRLEEEVDGDEHQDDRRPDAGPGVGAEEGQALGHARLVQDRGVGHHGAGGRQDGHGLAAKHGVRDAADGGGEDHLSRAEHARGRRREHRAERDREGERGEEQEEDGRLRCDGTSGDEKRNGQSSGGGGGSQRSVYSSRVCLRR